MTTRRPRHTVCLLACLLGVGALAERAHAHVVVLLDRDLKSQIVDLQRISGGRAIFTSPAGGDEQSLPLDRLAAIVEPSWWNGEPPIASRESPAEPPGIVELTDGRRVLGRPDLPAEPASDGRDEPPRDTIRWEHTALLGLLEFRLEDVSRVRLPGFPDAPVPATLAGAERDRVFLTNGDVLSGLVERFGLEVWVSDRGSITRAPINRVREARLVNPAAPPRGTMIWLDDGTVFRVEHIGADPQHGTLLGIEPSPGKSRQVFARADQVRALVPDAQRLVPLSSLAITDQRAVAGRVAPMEPASIVPGSVGLLGAGDVDLPGPMSVTWTLPPLAARVGGWLILPVSSAAWGDYVVRIDALSAGGSATTIVERGVSGDRAAVLVSEPLPAGATSLRVTIDPGAHGPIQDRLILHRFLIAR